MTSDRFISKMVRIKQENLSENQLFLQHIEKHLLFYE